MSTTYDRTQLSETARDFIDIPGFHQMLETQSTLEQVKDVLAKSMEKKPLTVEETAVLLMADDQESVEHIFEAARQLKKDVYGNRIVLFAPLYIGNHCTNDCSYCGFRRSNPNCVRRTLNESEIRGEIEALERVGHKRLILVFGEHPHYDADFIAESVRTAYSVRVGHGEIRRVNINAAPLDAAGFKTVKDAGIGTYQIFQETYHRPTYAQVHPEGTSKSDFMWRLDGLSRAMEAGCDDVGVGALFGLYDWRFDALGLIAHSQHLEKSYGVGPHTLSFPRLRPASGVTMDPKWDVSDHDFKRLVAILRVAVPYAGMILTAREPVEVRREILRFGVSQIDGGTKIELGAYTEKEDDEQSLDHEQFEIGDTRTLDEIVRELLEGGDIPSFCTACYRLGRTGEQFMEFAIPGFIQQFCTPNALSTLTEYLVDYASEETRQVGRKVIAQELDAIADETRRQAVANKLQQIEESDSRDLYF